MTTKNDDRAERLKAALRENLRRRKGQVRGRREPAGQDAPAEDSGTRPQGQDAFDEPSP